MFGPVPWRIFQKPKHFKMLTMHIKLLKVSQLDTLHIMPTGLLPHTNQHLCINLSPSILPIINPQTMPPLQPKLFHLQVQNHLLNLHPWIQLPRIRLLMCTKMPTVLLFTRAIACQFICLLKVSVAVLWLCQWNLLSQLLRCLFVQRLVRDSLPLRILCESYCAHLSAVWSCEVSLVQKYPNPMYQV